MNKRETIYICLVAIRCLLVGFGEFEVGAVGSYERERKREFGTTGYGGRRENAKNLMKEKLPNKEKQS